MPVKGLDHFPPVTRNTSLRSHYYKIVLHNGPAVSSLSDDLLYFMGVFMSTVSSGAVNEGASQDPPSSSEQFPAYRVRGPSKLGTLAGNVRCEARLHLQPVPQHLTAGPRA